MSVFALVLVVFWLATAFGVRAIVHRARTGNTGYRGFRKGAGGAERLAGLLFLAAVVGTLIGAVTAALGWVRPLQLLQHPVLQGIGVLAAVVGIIGTLVAQAAMGASWRVGVDPNERTDLVVSGLFRLVRNPIFAAMILASGGVTLMIPNLVVLTAFIALVAAIELQVRLVEEPYLLRVHPASYLAYGRQVGRFVPGLGRLKTATTTGEGEPHRLD